MSGHALYRLHCPHCGALRVFRDSDLFGLLHHDGVRREGDDVVIAKPCPSCEDARTLRLRRPAR